jgi:cytochrome oxidase Cu insertion factor (SCO1/SenC/PrrC family)
MAKLQSEVKEIDVRLVSFTVDPENDTPERLRSFAEAYGADPERWLFLAGEKNATYELIKDSFQLPVAETVGKDRVPGYEVLHSNKVALVDAQGRVQGLYNGTDPVEMAKLRNALEEHALKSQPKLGESEPEPAAEEG